MEQYLLIVSRVIFGGYFIMSGIKHFTSRDQLASYASSKKIPSPKLAVVISGIVIILGGLGIMLSLYVPESVALIVLFLIIVTFSVHNFWTISDRNARSMDQVNFMKNMVFGFQK
ncbi:MAG: DoxX family membrane protein [bacterium]